MIMLVTLVREMYDVANLRNPPIEVRQLEGPAKRRRMSGTLQ